MSSDAATSVTISTVAGRCAAVVTEYSGVLIGGALDQTAASPGAFGRMVRRDSHF